MKDKHLNTAPDSCIVSCAFCNDDMYVSSSLLNKETANKQTNTIRRIHKEFRAGAVSVSPLNYSRKLEY